MRKIPEYMISLITMTKTTGGEIMKENLKKVYEVFPWKMRPGEREAHVRFEYLVELFKESVDFPKRTHILDIAAGSGIAGVAMMKAAEERGAETSLCATDVREDDLKWVHEWADLAGVSGDVETIAIDASKVHEIGEIFDVAILWGSSTPHFSPDHLLKVFSSVALTIKDTGIFLVEEIDRTFRVFLTRGYKEFLVEGENAVSIHSGYDHTTSMFIRKLYKLPGFEYVSDMKVKMWDTPTVAAFGKTLFRNVKIVWSYEHGGKKCGDVIIMKDPRKNIASEIVEVK